MFKVLRGPEVPKESKDYKALVEHRVKLVQQDPRDPKDHRASGDKPGLMARL
jgi:hypothetical protein